VPVESVAVDDAVGVAHDGASLRLAMNLGQADAGDASRGETVPEDSSGPNGRKLVDIADQDDAHEGKVEVVWIERREEHRRDVDGEHRGFVDDDRAGPGALVQLAVANRLGEIGEAHRETVDRLPYRAGQFAGALGGLSRGGDDKRALATEDVEDRARGERLAGTGPAREDEEVAGGDEVYGATLLVGELFGNLARERAGDGERFRLQQAREVLRNDVLRTGDGRSGVSLFAVGVGPVNNQDLLAMHGLGQRSLDDAGRHWDRELELVQGGAESAARHPRVAVFGLHLQRLDYCRGTAEWRVGSETLHLEQVVVDVAERDAVHADQAIRVGIEDAACVLRSIEVFEHSSAQGGAEAKFSQAGFDIEEIPLLLETLHSVCTAAADARHINELVRVGEELLYGRFGAKLVDEPGSPRRPDAGQALEHAHGPFACCGVAVRQALCLELRTIAAVLPHASDGELGPDRGNHRRDMGEGNLLAGLRIDEQADEPRAALAQDALELAADGDSFCLGGCGHSIPPSSYFESISSSTLA
jgi:hypothetical protein